MLKNFNTKKIMLKEMDDTVSLMTFRETFSYSFRRPRRGLSENIFLGGCLSFKGDVFSL